MKKGEDEKMRDEKMNNEKIIMQNKVDEKMRTKKMSDQKCATKICHGIPKPMSFCRKKQAEISILYN